LRTFRRFPQTFISHQRRLWLLLLSRNNQEQVGEAHARTAAKSSDASNSATFQANGQSAAFGLVPISSHLQENPPAFGTTIRCPPASVTNAFTCRRDACEGCF